MDAQLDRKKNLLKFCLDKMGNNFKYNYRNEFIIGLA